MNVLELRDAVRHEEGGTLGPINAGLGPGHVLNVSGPPGSGKTTLLRLIWGFVRPHRGTVSVFGRPPHLEQIRLRERAGYVPGPPRSCRRMRASDYLDFTSGFYPNWDPDRAAALVRRFNLGMDTPVESFDALDRVHLALVAATTHRPQLLVLDEPEPGLDRDAWGETVSFVEGLARNENTAIVVASRPGDAFSKFGDSWLFLKAPAVSRGALDGGSARAPVVQSSRGNPERYNGDRKSSDRSPPHPSTDSAWATDSARAAIPPAGGPEI